MWAEFRSFIARGNVVDLAVGVVIGAAFTSVVNSLVNDVLMPPLGLLTGGLDFSGLFLNLSAEEYATLAAAKEAGAPTINYGLFINSVVSFLIVSFAVFVLVKQYSRLLREPAPAADPTEKPCPYCKFSIPLDASRCGHCTSELIPA
ncbi:MAG TPA: large conductance mechanosensitive channel protein MscL [Longimicrobiales bacterium]